MIRIRFVRTRDLLLATVFCTIGTAFSGSMANPVATGAPGAQTLLDAARSDDWLLPAKSYLGNRYSTLSQITPENVATLGLAWKTQIFDDGQQEASPIVTGETMYISTPHDNVLALDARTGKLKWQFPYNPPVVLFAVNRGVGIADGKVFLGTQDCRLLPLDAQTGKPTGGVARVPHTPHKIFSIAAAVL